MKDYKITYILVAYNHEKYIEDALISAINQTHKGIEYIFSDDCSTDSTYNVMYRFLKKHPEKNITLNRNNTNVGIGAHMNKVMHMGSGDLIIMAAGDDISELNRVEVLLSKWINYDKPAILGSSITEINEVGEKIVTDLTQSYRHTKDICLENSGLGYLKDEVKACAGATLAYSRDMVNYFPPFNEKIPSEDVIMFFRGLIFNKVCVISEPLMKYRRTATSFSAPVINARGFFLGNKTKYPLDLN